jgi:hypothetical protein
MTNPKNDAAALQHPPRHQDMFDITAELSEIEGIRQGLSDAKLGKTRPALEFFREFEGAYGMFGKNKNKGRRQFENE